MGREERVRHLQRRWKGRGERDGISDEKEATVSHEHETGAWGMHRVREPHPTTKTEYSIVLIR